MTSVRITMTEQVTYCHDFDVDEVAEALGCAPTVEAIVAQLAEDSEALDETRFLDEVMGHFSGVEDREWTAEEAT